MQNRLMLFAAVLVAAGVIPRGASAQRIQPQPAGPPTYTAPPSTYTAPPGSYPPPAGSGTTFQGGANLSAQPTFDPYATSPDAASRAPSLLGTPTPGSAGAPAPYWQPPPTGGYTPGYTTPGYGTGGYVQPYPQQPPVLFPHGLNLPSYPGWPQAQPGPYLRLFQDLRMKYTWLAGDDSPREMEINEVEVATTVNFPNFLWSGLPLQVSPVFIFHFWDGPDGDPTVFPTELPSRVYSTFLDFNWDPMLTPMLGADLNASIGVYSDFDEVTSDSVRFQGTGLVVLALTPTLTVKAGVNYLDRVDIKLLPAGGLLWTPNPQTRFDIFFPKPKLAQYLTTIGNTDVWWYLNGEYGGGSWTVERAGVTGDQRVDVNDIRAGGGLEWYGHNGIRGFVEAAYVFERELFFASGGRFELDETIMVRGGLAY